MNTDTTATTAERITKIVAEHLGLPLIQVTPSADWEADLSADSLDHVELIMNIEDEFHVEIPDEDAVKISSVQQAVDWLNGQKQS